MKLMSILFLLTLITACDPYRFGFEKNPTYVLDEAFKSISNLDTTSFLEVTAKEALCVYGNEKGLEYLKDHLPVQTLQVGLKLELMESKRNKTPAFVGFWSYYTERYRIKVTNKGTKETLLETIVDCDFGTNTEKDDKFQNLDPAEYKSKECKAVKLIGNNFKPLPVPSKCESLKVVVDK